MRGNRTVGGEIPRVAAVVLCGAFVLALLAGVPGCHHAAKEAGTPSAAPVAPSPAPAVVTPPPASSKENAATQPGPIPPGQAGITVPAEPAAREHGVVGGAAPGPPAAERKQESPAGAEPLPAAGGESGTAESGVSIPRVGGEAPPPGTPSGANGPNGSSRGSAPTAVPRSSADARETAGFVEPAWVREKEELRFRIRFLGVTVGYATFSSRGKVLVDGKQTYLLSVRAETSGSLSMIYPVKQAIDYYVDPATLAPVRQEYLTPRRGKDDEVVYDQEKGKIVYRNRKTGEISRRVDAVPNIYDPVTVAYYFRARDLGAEDRPQTIYAGRKVWAIATRFLGVEKIDTPKGRYETVLIQPIIMRDGRVEDKGTLRMWMTRDERHVPVRVYAKFRKILDWVLLGELVPDEKGG